MANDDIPSPSSQYWPIDYLSYVRHLNTQEHQGKFVLMHFDPYKELERRLKLYIEEHRLTETYASKAMSVCQWLPASNSSMKEDPITTISSQ